ncbi:hypothetical protein [Saccharothrix sp. NRRL B-16314]|uniref:hypothetical protein n=1 Tax=Saccharothrix sp. NRRL B-16314 TaxID=1463825 RepID=UPI00052675FC|nr:hypothetical protein [Saccharothrix sp. NRRL B-16314]
MDFGQASRVRLNFDLADVDWATSGDRLMDYMFAVLTRDHHVVGYTYHQVMPTPDLPYWHMRYDTDSVSLSSCLLVFPDGAGYRFFVDVPEENSIVSQTQPWIDALVEARERLSEPRQVFNWHAIVGVVGPQPGGVQVLTAPAAVGGMQVQRATNQFREAEGRTAFPSLSGFSVGHSYPVFVEGRSMGFDWAEAALHAAAACS